MDDYIIEIVDEAPPPPPPCPNCGGQLDVLPNGVVYCPCCDTLPEPPTEVTEPGG
jgi:hypothetical protein